MIPFVTKRLPILILACAVAAPVSAQVTWAWGASGQTASGVVVPGTVDTDISGNAYFSNLADTSGTISVNATEFGAAGNLVWHRSFTPVGMGSGLSGASSYIKVGPGASGAQTVYLVVTYNDSSSGYTDVALYALSETGATKYGPLTYSTNANTTVLGFDSDTSGNAYLALQAGQNVEFDKVSSTGAGLGGAMPAFDRFEGNGAYHIQADSGWLMSGLNVASTPNTAEVLEVGDTTETTLHSLSQVEPSNPDITYGYVAQPLPGGYIGVILNEDNDTSGTPAFTYSFKTLTSSWSTFRTAAAQIGTATGMSSFGVGYPNYVVGLNGLTAGANSGYNFVASFGPGLNLNWQEHLAATQIWADAGGFFYEYTGAFNATTQSNPLYVDYANTSGVNTWGHLYNEPTISPDIETFGGFVNFSDRSVYVLNSYQISSGQDGTYLNRYVFGTALNTITANKPVGHGSASLTYTVSLTAAAPTGGEAVSLYSGGGYITFDSSHSSSGTVVVPAGHASATFTATVAASPPTGTAVVTANLNDVIRTVGVSVTTSFAPTQTATGSGSAISSVSATLGSGVAGGNLTIAVISLENPSGTSPTITSVKDDKGDTFTLLDSTHSKGVANASETIVAVSGALAYCLNTTPGAKTITATFSISSSKASIAAAEYPLFGGSLDQSIGTNGTGGSALSGTSGMTSIANELVLGWLATLSSTSVSSPNPANNETLAGGSLCIAGFSDGSTSTTGTQSASYTLGSSSGLAWVCGVATFH